MFLSKLEYLMYSLVDWFSFFSFLFYFSFGPVRDLVVYYFNFGYEKSELD
jgi:hypothetical protein